MLDLFEDLKLGDLKLEDDHTLSDVKLSFVPKSEKPEDFDYNISFDMDRLLGLETNDLKFVG